MAALRVSDQRWGGPNGELDQSWTRISAPILPPPSRKPRVLGSAIDMHNPRFTLQLSYRLETRGTSNIGVVCMLLAEDVD